MPRIVNRQLLQQQIVNHGKNCSVGANPQRQRQNCNHRQSRRPQKLSKTVSHILPQRFDAPFQLEVHTLCRIISALRISARADRSASRAAHPLLHSVFHRRVEKALHLGLKSLSALRAFGRKSDLIPLKKFWNSIGNLLMLREFCRSPPSGDPTAAVPLQELSIHA